MRVSKYSQYKKIFNSRSNYLYFLFFILVFSIIFIFINIKNPSIQDTLTKLTAEPILKISSFVSTPVNMASNGIEKIIKVKKVYDDLESYNKEKLSETSNFQKIISLKMKVMEYEKLLNLSNEIEYNYVTARITGNFTDQFSENAFINAGKSMGLQIDLPIIGENGIVGRISEANNETSRILFITDVSSRVPVLISDNGHQGILIGNSKGSPSVHFVNELSKINIGDLVMTSGKGGVFPPFLIVGNVISKNEDTVEVELSEDIDKLNYVRALKVNKLFD